MVLPVLAAGLAKRYAIKKAIRLCFSEGRWMNFLPAIACILYTAVTIGCLSLPLRFLRLAAVDKPNGDAVRIGYFGLCVKTAAETQNKWTCSRFLKPTSHLVELTQPIKALQWKALFPLPAVSAVLLFILWVAYLLFRNHSEKGKKWTIKAMWVSVAVGFAGALLPMGVGRAMEFAAPIYESKVKVRFSFLNEVVSWIGFAVHLGYVVSVNWWERREIGGHIV